MRIGQPILVKPVPETCFSKADGSKNVLFI